MPGGHDGGVVLVVEGGAAEVSHADARVPDGFLLAALRAKHRAGAAVRGAPVLPCLQLLPGTGTVEFRALNSPEQRYGKALNAPGSLKALRGPGRRRRPEFQFVPSLSQCLGPAQSREDAIPAGRGRQAIPDAAPAPWDTTHLVLVVQSVKIRVDKQDVLWLEVSVSQLVVV